MTAALLVAALPQLTHGQDLTAPARRAAPLTRYVPAGSSLFISVRRLDEVDAALRRAHAWRLMPLLTGSPADGRAGFDLRRALSRFVGDRSPITVSDLMQSELGIVAPSWLDLGRAVWLVRAADERTLERWSSESGRRRGATSSAQVVSTETGLMLCFKHDIVAMGRPSGVSAALTNTMLLLAGRKVPILEEESAFQDLMAYLPAKPLAVAYIRNDQVGSQSASSNPDGVGIDRAVAGLYEGEGRLDVAIRASAETRPSGRPLPGEAVRALLDLPQTTLVAATLEVDFDKAGTIDQTAGAETAGRRHGATLGRVITLLRGLRGPVDAAADPLGSVSPNLVVAWDQDLRGESNTPQLAVLLESPAAATLEAEAARIAENAVKLISAVDPVPAESLPQIQRSMHLGVPVSFIPLGPYAEHSHLPFVPLLGAVEPAWAVTGEWFVFALSRDHVERILDARLGLIPKLATVADVRALTQRGLDRLAALTVVQADLAADILQQWVADHERGAPSLLDASLWPGAGSRPASQRHQLGIGMQVEQEPGVVVVARVYPGKAAAGRLRPGDRILGIDGELLDLHGPNADLRAKWSRRDARLTRTLRVQRDAGIIDVPLDTVVAESPAVSGLATKPAEAVRELASLAQTLQFASFASYATDPNRYSARLSLRFAPVRGE